MSESNKKTLKPDRKIAAIAVSIRIEKGPVAGLVYRCR